MAKILFVSKNIPLPGVPSNKVILNIAKLLEKEGHKVKILFPKEWVPWGLNFHPKYKHLVNLKPWNEGELEISPFTYPRIPEHSTAFWLINLVKNRLSNLVNRKYSDSEVVHGHYLLPDGWIANQIADELNIPSIITIRSSDIKLLRKSGPKSSTWDLATKVIKNANHIHCLNGTAKDFLQKNFSMDAVLIPHGLPDQMLGKNIQWEKDIDLLVVSELIKRKQVDWVIRAFKRHCSGIKDYSKKMVIIGDGPLRKNLEKITDDMPNIEFTGRIPHQKVINYMERSRVFALPSYQETMGLVYLEAAANANSIISLRGEGIDGVFSEEDGVHFVACYKTFDATLDKLLSQPLQSKQDGEAAYLKVQNMGWSQILKNYNNLYFK